MAWNPHPPLTGLPSALLLFVVVAECLAALARDEQRQKVFTACAGIGLWMCVLIAPLTYFSGYWGADIASAPDSAFTVPEEVINRHEAFGRFFLFLLVVTCLLRLVASKAVASRRALFWAYGVMLTMSFAVLVFTSFLGGDLVFSYGAGVAPKSAKH